MQSGHAYLQLLLKHRKPASVLVLYSLCLYLLLKTVTFIQVPISEPVLPTADLMLVSRETWQPPQNVLYFSSSGLEGNTAQSIQMIYTIGAEPTTISNARQFKVGFVYIIIT